MLLALLAAGVGAFALPHLPVDAVPDITNNQVQINTPVASLSPMEIEKQVTFPIETALAGIPGLEYTRSLSRNGFSQVTAVFAEDINIYFARNQVSERLGEAKESLAMGLVNHVVPHDQLMVKTYEIAAEIAASAPLAVQATKRMMRLAMDETFEASVHHVFLQLLPLFRTQDFQEGFRAFLEKRTPVFQGK